MSLRTVLENVKVLRRETVSVTSWSPLICFVLLASFVLSCLGAFLVPIRGGVFDGFNSHLIEMVATLWHSVPSDHRRTLLTHKLFLLLIAVSTMLISFAPAHLLYSLEHKRKPMQAFNQMLVAGAFLFFSWSLFSFTGTVQDQFASVFLAIGALVCSLFLPRIKGKATLLIAIVLISLACVPAFAIRPDFSDLSPIDLLQSQQHYAVCISFSDQMAAGVKVGKDWLMHYGVLGPTMLAAVQKFSGILSFRNLVNLVEASQILFLVLISLALYGSCRRAGSIFLLALLTVIPWYHCNQLGILYPNHSGLRLLAVFAALSVVVWLHRIRPVRLAQLMGVSGCLAALYNFETGITLCVGFLITLGLWRSQFGNSFIKQVCSLLANFSFGAIFAGATFVLGFYFVSGTLPYLLSPGKLTAYFKAPQIITIEGMPAAIALMMFVHSAYLLLRTARIGSANTTFLQAFKAGIAFILLVWEMYYFNRPYYSNLATCWALYSFLLVDSMRTVSVGLAGRLRFRSSAILCLVSLILIVIPYTIMSYRESWPSYGKIWEQICRTNESRQRALVQSQMVSGVLMPKEMGQYIVEKSRFLKSLHSGDCRFLTIYSLLVPKASGVQQAFPYIDPYFGINLERQYSKFLGALVEGKPKLILLDDPASDPVLKNQTWYHHYLNSVLSSVSNLYALKEKKGGWIILELR